MSTAGACAAQFDTPPVRLIEDTDRYRVEHDYLGRLTKLCKGTATVPLPLEFPVKGPDDWLRLKRHFEFDERRIEQAAIDRAIELQKSGTMVRAEIPGGWDMARELMGEEEACLAYYTQPDLMHDILATLRETSVKVLERVTEQIVIDQLYVHEDMAGKSGPLIGPQQVSEFLAPYYRAAGTWYRPAARGCSIRTATGT